MPLIGAVQARDRTTAALAAAIAAKLRNGYIREPHVAVEIEAYRPFFILGEVTAPGQYPYVANMTAETAVAIAGGFTPRACKSNRRASAAQSTASSTAATSPSTSRSGPAIPSSSPNDGSEMPAAPDRPLKILHVLRAAGGRLVPPRASISPRTGRARPSGRHRRRTRPPAAARADAALRGAGAATRARPHPHPDEPQHRLERPGGGGRRLRSARATATPTWCTATAPRAAPMRAWRATTRAIRVYTPHGGSLHYRWRSPIGLLYLTRRAAA